MKKIVQQIINTFGYEVNRLTPQGKINKTNLLHIFYNNLIEVGFNPKFIVDIGANTGTWTRECISFFPNAKVLMIEPQDRLAVHYQDLLGENISYLTCGVSDKNDILKFTFHERDDSCSFIYSEEEAKEMGLEQKEIPVKTLNSIITQGNFPCPDIIKIDAEGLDLEVIDGASNFFGKTEVFLVEASVCNNVYKNTVAKIISKMDEYGYQMFDITDLNRPFQESPILWLIEIAFVKKNGYIINKIKVD